MNDSINSKIPSILDDIHELTLGPNAVSQEDSTPELVDTKETSASEKTTQPCQDPSISSEETDIYDEEIRIYLKNECLERSNFDSSKVLFLFAVKLCTLLELLLLYENCVANNVC